MKSLPGTATNHSSTWAFHDADKARTIGNLLHFTDTEAKELKSQLEKAARELCVKESLPRIEAAVFLSAGNLKSRLDEFQRQRVYAATTSAAQVSTGSGPTCLTCRLGASATATRPPSPSSFRSS